MEHQAVKDTRCFLSITSGLFESPDGVAESLAIVAKPIVSPISPPFSGHRFLSMLGLESRHVRSTGDDSQAHNLLERVLHLAQGQLIVSYVFMVSIDWNSLSLAPTLFLIKEEIGPVRY
jgi:hypothetical protein